MRRFARLITRRVDLLYSLQHVHWQAPMDSDILSMAKGVLQIADMQVRDIMVPRAQMIVVQSEHALRDNLRKIIESGHSRFPVVSENQDLVLGVLLAKDLLRTPLPDEDATLDAITDRMREAVFIPESKRLNVLLSEFRVNRNHMAIVVDEYGGISGLVTIEDVLEEIVGEIGDEHDAQDDVRILNVGNGNYIIKSLTPVAEFNRFFNAELSDQEYDTVGGVLLHHAGHMPVLGEVVQVDALRFKVVACDSRRMHTLQLLGNTDKS